MPEVDPKTGKPKSDKTLRLEALEAENKTLQSRVETLEKKLKEAEEAEESGDDGDW